VLVRHGESQFNKLNLFTGWIDVPLSEKGIAEAERVATYSKKYDYAAAFTSHLERAHETLLIIAARQKKMSAFRHESDTRYAPPQKVADISHGKLLPVFPTRALNERAYGILQGTNKEKAAKHYGAEQILKWRRGFADRPPQGESLKDVYKRAVPYFRKHILSRLKKGETVLVVSHGNTLRALIKHLENIDDSKIPLVHLPFARPLVYEYKNGVFQRKNGGYNFARRLR